MKKVLNLYFQIVETLIRNISGRIGTVLRRKYYTKRFAQCGKNLVIDEGVIIQGAKDIFIGDNVWIDKYCILMAGKVDIPREQVKIKQNKNYEYMDGELHIGTNVHIAPQCIIQAHGGVSIGNDFTASAGSKIYSLSNDVQNCKFGTYTQREINYIKSPIVIKDNVWIGVNTLVLAGTIENDSFVTPNSVVITNIKENSFAGGNPAKIIKDRFESYGK